MPDDTTLIEHPPLALSPSSTFAVATLPLSLQIFFDDSLFKRCQTVANYLAKCEGYAPRHLIGKNEACFAVVSRALTWRLDPYAVAQATYQTPGGQVGYFGSLCQAIIENSGRLVGGVKFEHYGDWSKLRGRFRIATNEKGTKYPVAAWDPADEAGLGVKVSAQIKDEADRREMEFDLVQAFPRNSTLWATDPRTQICYTAVRRFGTSTVPTLFMGVPFDNEAGQDWADGLKDVTPLAHAPPRPLPPDQQQVADQPKGRGRPRKPAVVDTPADDGSPRIEHGEQSGEQSGEARPVFEFADEVGEIHSFDDPAAAVAAYAEALDGAGDIKILEALWENGGALVFALREAGQHQSVELLHKQHEELAAALDAPQGSAPAETARSDNPEAAATPAAEVLPSAEAYDVKVPLAAGMSAQGWFPKARAKLKRMAETDHCPPADFARFRAENSEALAMLQRDLGSWFSMVEGQIKAGEQAKLV